jgi:hypothetical protein
MSKKDNKYLMKNKDWTEKEVKEYLTQFLHGFNIQEIAAGPAVKNKNIEDPEKHEKYLRQQHSVDEKLKDYMRRKLNTHLVMDPHKWGTLFFISGINTICTMAFLEGFPKHILLVQESIERMYEVFSLKASQCIIDLVDDPTNVTQDPKDNVYVALLDAMQTVLSNESFILNCTKQGPEHLLDLVNSYTTAANDIDVNDYKDFKV